MKAFRIISSDKWSVTDFSARLEFLNKGTKGQTQAAMVTQYIWSQIDPYAK